MSDLWRTRLVRIRMELPEGFQAVMDQAIKEIYAELDAAKAPPPEEKPIDPNPPIPLDRANDMVHEAMKAMREHCAWKCDQEADRASSDVYSLAAKHCANTIRNVEIAAPQGRSRATLSSAASMATRPTVPSPADAAVVSPQKTIDKPCDRCGLAGKEQFNCEYGDTCRGEYVAGPSAKRNDMNSIPHSKEKP